MGGTLILFSLVAPTLLWCDLRNKFIWIVLLVTVGYGVVGFLDDYLKLSKKNTKGLPGRYKLILQGIIGLAAVLVLFRSNLLPESVQYTLALPFVNFQRHPI